MTITQVLPEIPATPGLPQNCPRTVPAFLAPEGSKLENLVSEFTRLIGQYGQRAEAHRGIANPSALNTAAQDDDLAHARAVRDGQDDPGPVHITAWKEAEDTARRAVAGSRDAVKLVWDELVAALADPDLGGTLTDTLDAKRDEARTQLHQALAQVEQAMSELDVCDDQADYAHKAYTYATAIRDNGQPIRDGNTLRWPAGGASGKPQPIVLNARPEPRENVLAQLRDYRASNG